MKPIELDGLSEDDTSTSATDGISKPAGLDSPSDDNITTVGTDNVVKPVEPQSLSDDGTRTTITDDISKPVELESSSDDDTTTLVTSDVLKPPSPIFEKFSELLPELRLRVWLWALKERQIVEAVVEEVEKSALPQGSPLMIDPVDNKPICNLGASRHKNKTYFLPTLQQYSALLYVNSESRYEAEKIYKSVGISVPGYSQPRTSASLDTLWFADLKAKTGFDFILGNILVAKTNPAMI